ncbi:hypothetical protein [Butyrivibrio sp. AE3004]|uniref:hypothetical protein n=1 Tax=Butyrivibrio sp. AE3004 TaxID=1506994 RepID=UPI000494667A|nr:hypothetical protein [Butyrivibrio sp. AE3004]
MKKKNVFLPLILCVGILLAACGRDNPQETEPLFEQIDNTIGQEESEQPQEQDGAVEEENAVITEDQAYNAVINYCKATDPDFSEEVNSEGYTEYWEISTNEDGEIVVLYRSYTAAQIRYYVNPKSGETYVTELVPGIIDEEQKTGETFNVRDYI